MVPAYHRGQRMADTQTVQRVTKLTGYWSEGIFKGVIVTAPVLLMLGMALGSTIWLIRKGLVIGSVE